MIISLAPMQGYTDAAYRVALHSCIGGIDKYYAPYLKYENDGRIKNKYLNDILSEFNSSLILIPQILTNKIDEFDETIDRVIQMGYRELNWNLGCPYPMVTNKKLGAGLLPHPEIIEPILEAIFKNPKIEISIKLRSGLTSRDEIFRVIDILNQFPIKELIIHPRVGKQLYKGIAERTLLYELVERTKIPLAYNGDISNSADIQHLMSEFPSINHFMIGRGLLTNPFLGIEIKENQTLTIDRKRLLFKEFHQKLFNANEVRLAASGQLLTKMIVYWQYLSELFENNRRVYKEIRKCKSVSDYQAKCNGILSDGVFV